MPNRPPPPGPTRVTLQPGGALAAKVGIDQETPLANTVQLAGTLPAPAAGSTPVTLVGTGLDALGALAAALAAVDDAAPQQGLLVQGRDNSSGDAHPFNVDGEGNLGVFTQSLPLPQGAATENGNLAAVLAALRSVLQVAQTSAPLPANAAQEVGNLQAIALLLQDVLAEQRRQTVLLSAILGATGNGVPDQNEIDSQLTGATPWPQ